ncbi:hypothetical protein PFICI_10770 [Pestalotiopsis fici W106-1]|uniref:Clr5 domain-containing protein n=1 Tax=Pestalotiopsis fici (strain W106-1 / CGMCC3.15140) TaxID=1229662 RepID=W3WVM5_PESFW|nr:uncharacterized protein PFICI_10770 [Pestalotiopsis fici W106-1]ETS76896.1 hypothetical protein PFICI_10770 [Pestalotiopsis fici W106-1]
MYKHHFRKWNLKKRLSYDQVVRIVAHRTLTKPHAVSPSMDKIDIYVRRLPPEKYTHFKRAVASLLAAASKTMEGRSPERHAHPSPLREILNPPEKLQNPERLLRGFRNDITSILRPEESGKRSIGKPLIVMNDRWFHLVDAATTMVKNGHVDYGFGVIAFCMDRGRSFLENAPPSGMVRLCQVLFRVNQTHPELCQSMLRYLYQLARVVLPTSNQTRRTLQQMSSLDIDDLLAVEELLFRFCRDYAKNKICANGSDLKSAEKLRIWGWSGADMSNPVVRKMVSAFEQDSALWYIGIPLYPLRPELSNLHQDLERMSAGEWSELFGAEDIGLLMNAMWQSAPVIEHGHSLQDVATMQALHLCEGLMFQVDNTRTLEQIERNLSNLDLMCPDLTSPQAQVYRRNTGKYSRMVVANRIKVAKEANR